MTFNRPILAFCAVPLLWAGLALWLGHRLVGSGDLVYLAAMSAVAAVAWLAFVGLCVRTLRKGQPPTALVYVATAVIGSGLPAIAADLMQGADIAAAVELGFGVMGLAFVSSLLYVAVAGLAWRKA